ncbi:MAG: tRNA (5-methylaminomethyl-2-thiouridine)(34)-methyltransferase MnmD [Bacteroidota bacterium]
MTESRNISLLITADGSHTLYLPELNETYHSRNGAVQESEYVFIEQGFKEASVGKSALSILEIGFGTGLNALLTAIKSASAGIKTVMHTLEPYPLELEITGELNYTDQLSGCVPGIAANVSVSEPQQVIDMISAWDNIINGPWEQEYTVSAYFSLKKIKATLEDFSGPAEVYDLVYFDAFAPNRQPEVWQLSNMVKCYAMLKPGGMLVTYSAQGDMKRTLKEAGFKVRRLKGPPGKWQMVRAAKQIKLE